MTTDRDPAQSMQRVKVGLIGLAAVLLLIALAGLVIGSATREGPVTAIGAPKPEVVANMALDNGSDAAEPLVELGIAPSANAQSPGAAQ